MAVISCILHTKGKFCTIPCHPKSHFNIYQERGKFKKPLLFISKCQWTLLSFRSINFALKDHCFLNFFFILSTTSHLFIVLLFVYMGMHFWSYKTDLHVDASYLLSTLFLSFLFLFLSVLWVSPQRKGFRAAFTAAKSGK